MTTTQEMEETLDKCQKESIRAKECLQEIDRLEVRIRDQLKPEIRMEKLDIDDITKRILLLQIFKWIDLVHTLDGALTQIFHPKINKDKVEEKFVFDEDTIQALLTLYCRLWTLSSAIESSQCEHLRNYVVGMHRYWKEELILHFKSRLEDAASKLHWPQYVLDREISDNETEDEDENAMINFRNALFVLDEVAPNGEGGEVMSKILSKPLKKRFKFHFYGNKKTNNVAKPEWYMQQIWKWIKSSEAFFTSYAKPRHYSYFIDALLDILRDKILVDLEEILNDDVLFSHMIDEILTFTRDLTAISRNNKSSVMTVLQHEVVFRKWIDLERKFALEKLDGIFLDDAAWTESSSNPLVSKSAVRFVSLLQSMTERYKFLPRSDLKLKFIELQNELLEDLRLRLVQISRTDEPNMTSMITSTVTSTITTSSSYPVNGKFCLILESVKYIMTSISKWSETPFFMKLEYETEINRSLFSDPLARIEFVINDMIRILGDYVFYEVKARSRGYCFDKDWTVKNINEEDVSTESLPMLQTLLSYLNFCSEKLTRETLAAIAEIAAFKIKDVLIRDVILEKRFSSPGCLQMAIDIQRGFLPIFNEYIINSNVIFEELNEVCILLKLNEANAALLLDTINRERSLKKISDILNEFHLYTLRQDQVVSVLSQRILSD